MVILNEMKNEIAYLERHSGDDISAGFRSNEVWTVQAFEYIVHRTGASAKKQGF